MSERRIVLRTDDGSEIELRWERGAKFVLEVNEQQPAPSDSSAGTAQQEAVSPEPPAPGPAAAKPEPPQNIEVTK